MGRPRQFDESTAIAAATAVFRQRGYTSTSIDHLVEATGVHRGSLYGVFGSKHGLFLRVLDAISVPDADSAERADVVLVALLELAATDPRVREHIGDIIRDNEITPTDLGERLLVRAGLTDDKESA